MYNSEDIMEHQETLILVGFLLMMTNLRPIDGCRPGTGRPSARPSGRNLVPLVLRQHIPNLSETTIGASGPAEGKITRTDKRFRDLVLNYNPLVVFKDEEDTDADHRMTRRCQDRVDTLAMLVANEWPSVKLRIIEAWDEDGEHSDGSLHFEGRAVDITTDDRDHEKYGKLARLAVEAGFDWVFYESKHHVHASVIADDSEAAYGGGCFSGESMIVMENGKTRKIEDLKVGDRILTTDRATGETKSTDVILLMHKSLNTITNFLTITATSDVDRTQQQITLTPNHLLFVREGGFHKGARWRARAVFAENIAIGDTVYLNSLRGGNTTDLTEATVTDIETVRKRGVYAPLTEEGTLVVDGVVASSYAVFHNEYISHALFLPLRLLWRMGLNCADSFEYIGHHHGVHWYPKYIFDVANSFLPTGILNP